MRKTFVISTGLASVCVITVAGFIYALLIGGLISQKVCFSVLTLLLIIFLFAEINQLRKLHSKRWLLNPVVVCSMAAFFLYFGITNILYFFPADTLRLIGIMPNVTPIMNKLMFIVIIGAVAMWLGYWSSISNRLLYSRALMYLQDKYFSKDVPPRFWVVAILYVIANLSRLLEVHLGIYGYSVNEARIGETILYAQFLILLDNLGLFVLIIVALQYYADTQQHFVKFYFFVVLFVELFWGVLSGMKSLVLLPFLCILMTQYLRRGYIYKKWLLTVPLIVFVAYMIVNPFREEKNKNPNFEATSVSGIVHAIVDAQIRQFIERKKSIGRNFDMNIIKGENDANVILQVMGRTNLTYAAAAGVDYADTTKKLPPGSPDFLGNLIKAPLGALIPRFIWQGKPIQDIGIWYTQVVMGKSNLFSSTAMSIFTNLYFVGGISAVFIGMFIIGIFQRIIFFISKPWISSAGVIVYLGLMPKFEFIAEGDSQTIVVFIFRIIPLLLIFQSLFYKHKSSSTRSEIV